MIKLDKYAITSDAHQYKLHEVSIAGDDAKIPGEEKLCNTTYHMTIEGLISALASRECLDAVRECESLLEARCMAVSRMAALETKIKLALGE